MSNVAPISSNLPAMPGGMSLTPGTAGTGASGGPRTSPLLRYWAAVKRAKWLVLLLTLAGLGGGVFAARLRKPTFLVQAQLILTPGEGATLAGEQWAQYFDSYQILEPVAIAHRLYIIGPKRAGTPKLPPGPSGPAAGLFAGFQIPDQDQPRPYGTGTFRLKISDDGRTWELTNIKTDEKERGNVGDSVGRKFAFRWVPAVESRWFGQSFEFDVITSREAADQVKQDLKITAQPPRNPKFLYLTYSGENGQQAADILNDLMQQFVTKVAANKSRDLTRNAHVLDSQFTAAQDRLHDYLRRLDALRTKNITLPRDDLQLPTGAVQASSSAYAAYLDKTRLLDQYRQDRKDLAAALAKDTTGEQVVDDFARIPTAMKSPELSAVVVELMKAEGELRQQRLSTSDSYPANRPLLAHVNELRKRTIPLAVRGVLRTLDQAIARTDSEVGVGARQLADIPSRTIADEDLAREEALQEKIVADLMTKYQDARTREESALADVAIQDQAVAPVVPAPTRGWMLVVIGVLGGLGAGLGLALLLDITDKRVRYADQVTAGLGLTILGVIPEIRRAKGEQPSAEEAAQVIEAFRTVRLNLAHSIGDSRSILTISSPSPGDGKSLVSSNLALSFAESGYRTLLIDGDTRRGELHRTFGAERRPGLLDFLAGELPMDALLRPTTHPQLQLITGGSRKRNAPELLGTTAMRELLDAMRDKFDVIVVDSPPLGAGIDPFVLGTLTGNLMLVLRAGATERDLAEAKLQIVDQLPIRLVGAVLNDVRSTMSDYKYYSYSYGYGAVDEGPARPTLAPGEPV